MSEVSKILSAICNGQAQASHELLPLVYDELRRLARQQMAQEGGSQTLDPTGLVHEVYLRLVGSAEGPAWNSRGHFFGAAALAMRRILVEAARRKQSLKRGGNYKKNRLTGNEATNDVPIDSWLVLDEAPLNDVAASDPLAAQVAELRLYAGLSGCRRCHHAWRIASDRLSRMGLCASPFGTGAEQNRKF